MNTFRHTSRWIVLLAAFVAAAPAIAQAADDSSAAKEKSLIEVLRSGEPADKAIACKELALYGSKDAVPELANLLADPRLASWARIALEAIPDPAADEALRKATETLGGKLLVGTINSIGVRRDSAAVESLSRRVKDPDAEVASAAAVALGKIGNAPATKTLRQALGAAPKPVRGAVAEGCILCAERLMADGKADEAAKIYDEVRRAEVPKQRVLEATRGAIVARKSAAVPLLVEQLSSSDKALFQIALMAARELPGQQVADALAAELARATPQRSAMLLYALADRKDSVLSPAVVKAANEGDKQVRIAAIRVVGRSADAASLSTLLAIAAEADEELAAAAKTSLAGMPGKNVNADIVARLAKAEGKPLSVLIEVVGQRRIDATAALLKAVEHRDAAIRGAALTALGETIGQKELRSLVTQAVAPKNPEDAAVALRALRAASVRMPDREACAAELAAAIPQAPVAAKAGILEILGAMGGPKALGTIAAAINSRDEQLQDAGSRVLGEWMSVDAAPVLLDLAKNASSEKYQVRALRGYIRLARQFTMPEAQRAEMCSRALEACGRADEQKLVLAVLERYPSVETLKVAIKAADAPEVKDDARRVAIGIYRKVGPASSEARELLAKIGLEPVKVEIVKAEYGVGAKQKEVTDLLRKLAGDLPVINLPSASYNDSLGGDPAPGEKKELKIQYRLNGKPGQASFAENTPIVLPTPK